MMDQLGKALKVLQITLIESLAQLPKIDKPHHGVMVSVLASEPQLGQIKDFQTGICCFSAKHAALRSKSKDWSARNQNYVSEWSDMSIRGLLFQ